MSGYTTVFTKEKLPRIQTLADDMKARKNKDFFWPTGTQVYVGVQGSGKTISALKHVLDLHKQYPKAKIVSNILLNRSEVGLAPVRFDTIDELQVINARMNPVKHYVLFQSMSQLSLALTNINNERNGVIYIIDEIHTYFNALDSKNIPMYVFTEISQQRKQRKLIIGTSQLFLRMAKPFREQCDNIIVCTTRLGVFTKQVAYDGMTLQQDFDGTLTGTKKKTGWFFQTRKVRNSFDTYQKVVSGKEQYEEILQKQDEKEPKKKK